MIITKIFQTKVHIDDSWLLYSNDIDAVVMDNLKQRFEGKCYMSCLILEILEVQMRSNFIFSKHRQDGSATCSVRVNVRGIAIKKHEILHDCVVKKIDKDGHIICKNQYSAVYIKASKVLQTIKQGQTIIALAGLVRYKMFESAISVNALPFIPIVDELSTVIYTVVVSNTPLMVGMLESMEVEIKKNESIDKDVYSFFIELLYPYKTKKKFDQNKELAKSINSIVEDKNGKTITISQPDYIPMDTPLVLIHDKVDAENVLGTDQLQAVDGGILITENYESIMGLIIHKYIEHMLTIRKLCESYSTMELVKSNNNIWEIYRQHRQ